MQNKMRLDLFFVNGYAEGLKPELYQQFYDDTAKEWQRKVISTFYPSGYFLAFDSSQYPIEDNFDITDMPYDEVKERLRSLPIALDTVVGLTWFGTDNAIQIRFEDFVNWFEFIIRPGGDEAVVIPHDFSWLLEISHEEIVSFAKSTTGSEGA